MNRQLRVGVVVLAMLLAAVPATTLAAAGSSTCTGGDIAPGTYQSLTIAGPCVIPAGSVTVLGTVTVQPGASLNAISPQATVSIMGNVLVLKGAIFILGCSPTSFGCPQTHDSIGGGLQATQALAVIVHGTTVAGHMALAGGGGGTSCAPNSALSAVMGFPIPAYSGFEDDTFSGGVSVSGYQSCWLGFVRNNVRGTVTFTNNKLADPDAVEIATNTIRGNLVCSGNSDAILGEGTPNVVTGKKLGQCAGL